MSGLTRFSVSVEGDLLERFDRLAVRGKYPTRSKAVADLMRESLVGHEWKSGKEVAAAIVMVYDHHRRNLSGRLTDTQHDYHDMIISSQHVHLDHHNCLEVVIVKGLPGRVEELARKLKATKGVKFSSLAAASTGKAL
jgi:CopG family transcriptional regulator, nickel-responsive regulator